MTGDVWAKMLETNEDQPRYCIGSSASRPLEFGAECGVTFGDAFTPVLHC
jgi:hypothetical protein